MKLLLNRRYKGRDYTIGDLYIDGVKVCETLEDIDRGLSTDTPEAVIRRKKVYGRTAIPTGTYHIDMNTVSRKFRYRSWAYSYGGRLPRLLSVPGYDGVLIHVGNRPEDTDGCILVGWNKAKGQVVNSAVTFASLMDNYLVPALRRHEDITITIK